MANIEKQLDLEDLDARLDNITKRQNCGNPVCPGLNYPPSCDLAREGQRCLVPYYYPMKLGEILQVAELSDYATKLVLEEKKQKEELAAEVKREPLPPFRPDWRFWTGVSAAGLGLFIHRSR